MTKIKIKHRNRIRQYRKKRHLKLKDIRRLINHKTCSHISHWEKGRKLPSLGNALKLSAALGCPIEILFLELFNVYRKEVLENRNKFNIKPMYEYDSNDQNRKQKSK